MSPRLKLAGVVTLLFFSLAVFTGSGPEAASLETRAAVPPETRVETEATGSSGTKEAAEAETAEVVLKPSVQIQGVGHDMDVPFEPLVDGSRNPGEVPDRLALRMFFQAIAIPPNPTPEERRDLQVRAGRIGLTDGDMEVLVRALGVFHRRMTDQRERIEARRASAIGRNSPDTGGSHGVRRRDGPDGSAGRGRL
jgi:hypothetical protein